MTAKARKLNDLATKSPFPVSTRMLLTVGAASLVLYCAFSIIFFGRLEGTDAENFSHWVRTGFAFGSSPIDISIISPYQGLGGLCQPLAVRLHIPYLLGFLLSPENPEKIITIASALFLGFSTMVLCRSLGGNWLSSLISGQLAVICFFPPMWVILLPWTHFMTTDLFSFLPSVAYPISLGILFLALFAQLGKHSKVANIYVIIGLGILFLYSTIVDPLYTAMFWIPVGFFCGGLLLGTETKKIFVWRLGGGAFIIIACFALNLFTFYYALFGNAARSVFPNELYVEIQKWDKLTGMFSHGGGSILISILLAGSCVYIATQAPRQMRWFAVSVGCYFVLMVAVSLIYVYSGIRWNLPLPVYLEIGAAPLYLILIVLSFAEVAGKLASKQTTTTTQHKKFTPHIYLLGSACVPLVCLTILIAISITQPEMTKTSSALLKNEADGLVTRLFVPSVSVQSDGRFRGSVAIVAAVPGGEIMRRANIPDNAPFTKENINFLGSYLRTFDPHLYMTGLWEMNIPTLEDNNHLVTPPFYYLFSRCLSRPQDFQSRNWTLCTKANPNLMAALGTRFIVTDQEIVDASVSNVATQTNGDNVKLSVYEIANPNLGNYSPTEPVEMRRASDIVEVMGDPTFPFSEKVIISDATRLPLLQKARFGEFFYEVGGFRVRAESPGWSLLVLPLQFSNSLRIVDRLDFNPNGEASLLRVNLLQTGVLFRGRIHIKVAHIFGLFRCVEGRIRDIEDWKNLGIAEDGTVSYPLNYQPLSLRIKRKQPVGLK